MTEKKAMTKAPRGPRVTNDLLAAGFLLACAGAFFLLSGNLTTGTHFQPGARYMPLGISALLAGLALAIALPELTGRVSGVPFEWPRARPFLAVLGIFAFALLIEPLGFILASLVMIVMAFAAYGRPRIIEVAGLATVLIGACILIFVVGLGQRFPLLP